MTLFHAAADAYDRHRPGLPDEVVHLLANALRGIRRPALLLLAAVFGRPGPGAPSSTVTFVFDGGRLTGEQFAHRPRPRGARRAPGAAAGTVAGADVGR